MVLCPGNGGVEPWLEELSLRDGSCVADSIRTWCRVRTCCAGDVDKVCLGAENGSWVELNQ